MNFDDVKGQLTDLPEGAFQRFGPIFASLINSISAAISRETRAIDQLSNMINLPTARWGWLSAIGLLYGIQRNQYENDNQFRIRLLGTLTATTGTPTSIVKFIKLALNINSSISENFSLYSYQINYTNVPSQAVIQQVAINIVRVRPAGIPFESSVLKGGLYLNTLNYFNVKRVTGAYLTNPSTNITLTLAPNTNNQFALLPTSLITDPYITGVANVSYPF